MGNALQFVSTNFGEQLSISATIIFFRLTLLITLLWGKLNHLKVKTVFLYLKQLKYLRNHAFDINYGVVLFF